MKIELDETYCCGNLMEKKRVIDVDTKRESVVFSCEHCKNSFEIEQIILPDAKMKMTSQ